MRCEVVLPVKNIDRCRYFYRETLALGEPVVDSCNFLQFQLNDDTMLTLERDNAPQYTPCRAFLRLELENFAAVKRNLDEQETALAPYDISSTGEWFRLIDPEGNILVIKAAGN